MNNYRRRTYSRKRSYSSRHRRTQDPYHQPLPSDQSVIPNTRHTLTKPDVEAVVDALLSGTLTNGGERERFESLLAKLTHSRFAISVNSGTAAIHAALARLQLSPEDEVITSTMNHCSVANMVHTVGATLVLVDCDPDTLTINVDATREAITSKTKVVFANNFAGHPSDMAVLRELCVEHSIHLLEDAGHGLGGKYRGHYVGNQADMTCFSFHPSKAITTCEGGAITTDNPEDAEWLRMFRDMGRQKSPAAFQLASGKPSYYEEIQVAGFNYRMSELHAALGRSQLTRLERHIDRRRVIANFYNQKLSSSPDLILPFIADWAQHSFHAYPLQLSGQLFGKRDEIFHALTAEGLDIRVHYVPIHRMPVFQGRVGDPSQFPNAEAYYHNCLSLPLFPDLSIKDLERVTDAILKVVANTIKTPTEKTAQPIEDIPSAEIEEGEKGETTDDTKTSPAGPEKPGEEKSAKTETKTRRRRSPVRKRKPKKADVEKKTRKDDEETKETGVDRDSTSEKEEEAANAQKSAGRLRMIPKDDSEELEKDETSEKDSPSKPGKKQDNAPARRRPRKSRKSTSAAKKETKSDTEEKETKTQKPRKTTTRKSRATKSPAKKGDKESAPAKKPRTQRKKRTNEPAKKADEKSSD